MKESKLYLNFFERYLSVFIISSLVFIVAGILFDYQKPAKYRSSILLEMNNSGDISEKIPLVQEAVTLARSSNFQKNLANSQITVFNNSPLTLVIESVSTNQRGAYVDMANTANALKNKFSLSQIGGVTTETVTPDYILTVIIFLVLGNLLVVSVLLIRLYIKNF